MQLETVQVIMLPAKSGAIHRYGPSLLLYPYGDSKACHLYFTSDEEIKDEDWYYWSVTNSIQKFKAHLRDTNTPKNSDGSRKIVATTDKKLIGVNQIPQSFVEEYSRQGGINEVNLEYLDWCDYDDDNPTGLDKPDWRLKLTPNNEVIIHLIKEKMYSKSEVEIFLKKGFNDFRLKTKSVQYVVGNGNPNTNGTKKKFLITNINNWIKENL
jgi:hypothetical protein